MWDSALFSSQYIPHGHCYLWQTPLVSLHAISDLLIAIAYFSIPISLIYFVYKQHHNFPTHLVLLFGLFISMCGLGHLFDIVTLWYPAYWISGIIRAATALISCYTAMEMMILLPRFLALQDVEAVNQNLEAEAAKRSTYEQALEKNQKIFRSAFYDIPIGMALVSLDGYFIEVNEAITKIVGYSSEELQSIDFPSITHPDDLEMDMSLVNDLLAGTLRYYSLEKRYIHRLGHTIPIELNVSLLRDSEDNPLLFIAHIQDISERNRINASLQAATEEAEAANQAKGSFLAMMSHEIRTPMNAMLGMTELMEDTRLDPQQKECVEVIRTSGKTLLTVINDILDFSKIESNKLELEIGRINLHDAVEDVVTLFSNQAREKGLSLSSSIEPSLIPAAFKGDAVRLKQILSNLLSNSIKFTDTGGINIQVKASRLREISEQPPFGPKTLEQSASGDRYHIYVSVTDTGIGISPEKVSNLFAPFSQVDSSITRRFGGTGLGLSISKRLVEMMNGQLSVDSDPGKGSVFYFSIELEACEAIGFQEHRQLLAQPILATSQTKLSDRAPLRILLTEDIALNQTVALKMLASYGYPAEVAQDGAQAIAAVQQQAYDLVFINMQMPKMGGLEATQKIRQNPHMRQPYIVAMTARAMQGDREECLSAGMDEYIQKPIRKQDILGVLQKCAQSKSSQLKSAGTPDMDKPLPIHSEKMPEASSGKTKPMGDRPSASSMHQPIPVSNDTLTLDTTSLESFSRDRSFLIGVFESFLTDAPHRIQALETALKQNNQEILVETAHALKSLSSCIGAMRLFQICQSIEAASREGIEIVTAAVTGQISMEYNNVQIAIQEYTSAQQ